MKKKGLCESCLNEKKCAFSLVLPVLQCEEFTTVVPKAKRRKKSRHSRRKSN